MILKSWKDLRDIPEDEQLCLLRVIHLSQSLVGYQKVKNERPEIMLSACLSAAGNFAMYAPKEYREEIETSILELLHEIKEEWKKNDEEDEEEEKKEK